MENTNLHSIELSTGVVVTMRKITGQQIAGAKIKSKGDQYDFLDMCICAVSSLAGEKLKFKQFRDFKIGDYHRVQKLFSDIHGWPKMTTVFYPIINKSK